MRKLGFRFRDRRRSNASGSAVGRDGAARTIELRQTLRIGAMVITVVQLVTGGAFASRYPDQAALFLTIWTAGAIASLAIFVAANRAAPWLVAPLTVMLAFIPATVLLGPAIEPRTLLAAAGGFLQLPIAVPLFMPWTRRVRTAWLVTYAGVGLITIVAAFDRLQGFERIDLATDIVIGACIGWVGAELLERMRERNRDQAAELHRLNGELHIRASTDALTGLANRRQLDTDLQILRPLALALPDQARSSCWTSISSSS